jgi:hypothetical protein
MSEMDEFCSILVSKHIQYLAGSFLCGENGDYTSIATPYTYADNDSITMYVKEHRPGALYLTDLGSFLTHAAITCGRDLVTTMREQVTQVVTRHDLMFESGEVKALCAFDDVGEAMLRMAMAAKEIDALTNLARAKRVANFDARFGTLLRSKGVHMLHKPKVSGASGMEYTVDFLTETTKKSLIQTITNEQGTSKIGMTAMVFDDLRDNGDTRPKLVVVEKALAPSKMTFLRKKADQVYTQEQLDSLLHDLEYERRA